MSRRRQLNALLFELQSASSPLEQAKAIARAWRTVRNLSPSERRLLARHAGFDGAEQLLERLARRRGGSAPSLLLQLLGELRQHDGKAVADLVSSLGHQVELAEPSRNDHGELPRPVGDDVREEIGDVAERASAPGPPRINGAGSGSPEDAAAALEALREVGGDGSLNKPVDVPAATGVTVGETPDEHDGGESSVPADADAAPGAGRPQVPSSAPALLPEWQLLTERPEPAPSDVRPPGPLCKAPVTRLPGVAPASRGGAEPSAPVLERFRQLRQQLAANPAGSAAERLRMVHAFPDGWQRRRAVVAILESAAVSSSSEGLDLIAALRNQVDRRWCLHVLLEMVGLDEGGAERARELAPERRAARLLHLV